MTGRGGDGDDPGRPGGGSAKGGTTGKGAGAGGGPEASASGAGGPSRTSTPAKTRSGRTSRRNSLTATSEFLQKEQQMLDKLDKEKAKKGNTRVPSETQTKIANYLRKVKESKETKKEEQDYRRDQSSATPAKPEETSGPGSSSGAGGMAATLKNVLQDAADATEAARAATAKGLPAMTMVAKQVAKVMQGSQKKPSIPGLNWAEEAENERLKQGEVILGTKADKAAEEALNKKKEEERLMKERQAARYRTYSSSSNTSAAKTGTGTGTDDDDFITVDRRRRGTRNRERYRIPRIQILLTGQQKAWYQDGRCLNCGGRHMVHNCRDRKFDKDKAVALLRAARKEFPEGPRPKQGTSGAKRSASERTGATPEAKKGKAEMGTAMAAAAATSSAPLLTRSAPVQTKPWFKPVQQTEHTLFIKNKDGSPLTEERFNELKASYDNIRLRIGKANMAARTRDELQFTPRCSGWNWSPEVARITLKDLDSYKWARTTFGELQIMDLAQWKASRGRLYCAYLTDRFDPSVTEMSEEDLSVAVWQAKADLKLAPEDLFQFVRGPKVARGRLIFISVGEKAEEALRGADFRIELGSAGDVLLTDNEKFLLYKKERKAQEQEFKRQKEAALAAQEEEEEEEEGDEATLTNEASVLVLEEKGEKEKGTGEQEGGKGGAEQAQDQDVVMEDDLDVMAAWLMKDRKRDEQQRKEGTEENVQDKAMESMETDGQAEPMQQS